MSQVIFCYDLAVSEPHELSVFSHCPDETTQAEYGEYGSSYNMSYDYALPQNCRPRSVSRLVMSIGN